MWEMKVVLQNAKSVYRISEKNATTYVRKSFEVPSNAIFEGGNTMFTL